MYVSVVGMKFGLTVPTNQNAAMLSPMAQVGSLARGLSKRFLGNVHERCRHYSGGHPVRSDCVVRVAWGTAPSHKATVVPSCVECPGY